MNDELITIIVPVYNVKDYLEKCVTSIIGQSYGNLEIILVDDGSTDGSGELCDYWKKQDSRINIIHKPNGGLSDARNSALDVITGEYVMFVDSDDWIDLDCCQVLLENILNEKADIASCRYRNIYPDGKVENIGDDHQILQYEGIDGLKEFLYGKTVDPFACAKLYKKEIIGNIRFIKGITGEDIPFNFQIFQKIQKIVVIGESFYNYRQQRVGSICNAPVSQKRIDSAFRWENIRQECLDKYPSIAKYALRRQTLFYIGLYNRIILGNKHFPETISMILQFVRKNIKCIIDSDITEKSIKIATWLLDKSPTIYNYVMRLYKIIHGEVRL